MKKRWGKGKTAKCGSLRFTAIGGVYLEYYMPFFLKFLDFLIK